MKNFDGIKFLGTFRSYRQRVLDRSSQYLNNNKIHIVAAHGSGKMILGLELIRRINSPCLVLSPTNTIKFEWGERFEEMYLPKGQKVDNYVSFDLKNIKPITSITYQALHSALIFNLCLFLLRKSELVYARSRRNIMFSCSVYNYLNFGCRSITKRQNSI